MASDVWKLYDSFKIKITDGTVDLATDTLKCALFTSLHVPVQTDTSYTSLLNELAAGNGYVEGGVALTGVTWTQSGDEVALDCDDIIVPAETGGFTFRYAIIYDSTDSGKQLVAMCLLNNTPADVVITTYDLRLKIADTGVFVLTSDEW